MAVERETVIPNKEGLHFRPIMQFVDIAQRYQAGVTVHCADRAADGRSPMEMLMLVATQGSKVRVVADGADAEQLLDELIRLVESGFGEM
ncbi:MAG TPA: HPr family phosphocarrier protein [Phycisphaerae bacterium]|nr:HPr family phosphocarrier protein [Phycisphaerae bacterium]HPM22990.1 HPr family phosphocarrier protein [Phycisphaerae bacterium]HQL53823.1 HPr family phosphocarrier protein [Phycisphaerae bacterium]